MKDPECRKRNLHIRTYTVVPLNETNGIIEWVNKLVPFRGILIKLYKEKHGKNFCGPKKSMITHAILVRLKEIRKTMIIC